MKQVFRSPMIQHFSSRYRTIWATPIVVAALVFLLTSATAYASTSTVDRGLSASSARTTMVAMTFIALPDANHFHCPADNICVFNGLNYTGSVQFGSFPGVNTYIDLHVLGGSNWKTLSYINNGDYRAWLNQFRTGNHGTSYCMSPNSRKTNITGPWDTDRWLLLSTNTSSC